MRLHVSVRNAWLKITILALVLNLTLSAAQNPPSTGVGAIQGIVTRAGTTDPLTAVQVTLQGGTADPQAMQTLLNTAAAQGIVVTPVAGASSAEILQALSNAAVARGFPLTTANLQSQLASLSGKTPPTTVTDREGRFSFKDVAPGAYTVRVQKEGFFGPPEGGISQPTAAVDVRVAAQETKDADLSMIPGAIVGGRIFDANGQLMSNAAVQILTVAYAFGNAVLAPLVSKVTDDRGEYRLFWVPPGDYYLAVTPRPVAPSPGVPATATNVKTFYPGVNDIAESKMISIRGGEDITGMDIGIRSPRSFKISGHVNSLIPPPASQLGAPGINAAVLMLLNREETAPDDVTARQVGTVPLLPTTGRFEVANVLPGNYELFARVQDPAAQVAGGQPVAWGRVRFDVWDMDINNLSITIPPSVEVKGTVLAGGVAGIPPTLRVQLMPADASIKIPAYQLVITRSATVTKDGAFSIAAVPEGRFRVSAVAGLPPDLYLADVRVNAMSVYDSGFDVSTRLNSPIEVVLGSGAGIVDGVVQDGPTKVVPGATVVLVPESRRRQNRALYFSASSDASGRFVIRGVPPGDYKLFAWESIPAFAYQNSAFMAKHEERGRAVHVGQGGTSSAQLTIIPAVEKK